MGLQGRWHKLSWGFGPKQIRGMENIHIGNGIEVTRNKTEKGKKASQTVALDLATMSFDYKVSVLAGGNPVSEYNKLKGYLGVHAPFYIGSKRMCAKQMMLVSVDADDWVLDGQGRAVEVTISLKFQQYATGKNRLMLQEIVKKKALRAGVRKPSKKKASALYVGPSKSSKAAKKKGNAKLAKAAAKKVRR